MPPRGRGSSAASVPFPVIFRGYSEMLLEHGAEVIAVTESAEMRNLRKVERIVQPDKHFCLFHSSFAQKLPETLSEIPLKQFPQIVGIDVQRFGEIRKRNSFTIFLLNETAAVRNVKSFIAPLAVRCGQLCIPIQFHNEKTCDESSVHPELPPFLFIRFRPPSAEINHGNSQNRSKVPATSRCPRQARCAGYPLPD